MNKNILIVGCDLTSNGGIASVIKSHYKAYKESDWAFEIFLLKTNYYKDKSVIFEFLILIKAFFHCLYYIFFKKVKILHIHSSANISFYRKSIFVLLGKLTGRKIILHLHSSDFYRFFLTENKMLKKYIYFIFKKADKIIVLCKDWETKLNDAYQLNTIIKIENPIDLVDKETSIKVNDNSANFVISFVGFLIESKGIKDLLEAGLRLKKQSKINVHFKIAGKGELENYILRFIQKNNLSDMIEYIGWVSGDSKRELYYNSNLFLLPSYKEGMPISILEAMSLGLPVISTNIAGIPDVIKQNRNGFLFTPGDIDELVRLINFCYDNQEKLSEIRLNNIEDIEKYSSIHIFEKIAKEYNNLN